MVARAYTLHLIIRTPFSSNDITKGNEEEDGETRPRYHLLFICSQAAGDLALLRAEDRSRCPDAACSLVAALVRSQLISKELMEYVCRNRYDQYGPHCHLIAFVTEHELVDFHNIIDL